MKILVQWAQASPRGWREIDSSDWRLLAKKPEPTGIDVIDDAAGWVSAICVQGVVLSAFDQYAVEDVVGGTLVTGWNSDPADWGAGGLYARQILFRGLAPDAALGGAINTAQRIEAFAQPSMAAVIGGAPRDWSAFVPPASEITKHGIWLADDAYLAHQAAASVRGWREWVDGLQASDLDGGLVVDQRRLGRYLTPDGTKTYYWSDTADATGIHAADHETALLTTTSSAANLTASIRKGSDELSHTARTQANQPNSAAWPTGDYRVQLDVTAAGADLTYGLLTRGGSVGHFGRIDGAGSSELETKAQQEGAFSGTGLKLATTGSVSWSSGNASDRFECTIACENTNSKNNQDLTLQVNELDDFADGPWSAAAARRIFIT